MYVLEIHCVNGKEILQQRNNPLYNDFTTVRKSLYFIMICWDPWTQKRVIYLSWIEGKGVWKTFNVFHNSTRQLFLYYKSLFVDGIWLFIDCSIINILFKHNSHIHNTYIQGVPKKRPFSIFGKDWMVFSKPVFELKN